MQIPQLERITIDPPVMAGKPCIRGIRITVGTITGLLAAGESVESWRLGDHRPETASGSCPAFEERRGWLRDARLFRAP